MVADYQGGKYQGPMRAVRFLAVSYGKCAARRGNYPSSRNGYGRR